MVLTATSNWTQFGSVTIENAESQRVWIECMVSKVQDHARADRLKRNHLSDKPTWTLRPRGMLTSAVTAKRKRVTYWNQGERIAPFSALRNDSQPLLHPRPLPCKPLPERQLINRFGRILETVLGECRAKPMPLSGRSRRCTTTRRGGQEARSARDGFSVLASHWAVLSSAK